MYQFSKKVVPLIGLGLLFAAVACSPSATSTPTAPAATATPTAVPTPTTASGTLAVDLVNFKLPDLYVEVGTKVTWTNRDVEIHTSTGDGQKWESANLVQGQAYSYTFAEAGAFGYFCQHHAGMIGKVTVTT